MARADLALVERGLASSRSRAQELIAAGRVFVGLGENRRQILKPSVKIADDEHLAVEVSEQIEYVSRGGIKLRGALERIQLDVAGFTALDVGISTGGFTDCLLRAGVRRVVGVDVGHDQLHASLRSDSRVSLLEGVNARELSGANHRERILKLNGDEKFDLIVVDVSFISLTLVLPELIQYLKKTAAVLALVKPQFEVGRGGLGKNGIVKDSALFGEVETKIRRCVDGLDMNSVDGPLCVVDYFSSSIEGSDGNKEFFVYAKPTSRRSS